jgi:hypothetical protein
MRPAAKGEGKDVQQRGEYKGDKAVGLPSCLMAKFGGGRATLNYQKADELFVS